MKRLLLLVVSLLACGVLSAPGLYADHHEKGEEEGTEQQAEPAVSIFPDKNLEQAVRKSVFEKRYNDEPITAEDVKDISTVTGKGMAIRDLTGMEHCLRLAALDLEDNKIVDLAPIAELKELQTVTLNNNSIRDISPLAGLKRLQYIQLEDNLVEDLRPLSDLANMNSLYLSRNRIKDVAPVAHLKKLWSLYLEGNQIEDLGPVSELVRLSTLSIGDNPIADLEPLKKLTELNLLMMEGTKVEDLSPLVEMAKRDREGDNRFAMFWRVYLGNNPLSEEALSKQVAQLSELGGRIHTKPWSEQGDASDNE